MITEQAVAAYDSEQFDVAFELLLPLAEQGDAEAQTMLGTLYQLGRWHSSRFSCSQAVVRGRIGSRPLHRLKQPSWDAEGGRAAG